MRLRMVKESAFGCSSVQSPNAGMYCSSFDDRGRDRRHGVTRDLRLARRRARVATQAGEPAHRFAEQAA